MESLYWAAFASELSLPLEIRQCTMKQFSRNRCVSDGVWEKVEEILADEAKNGSEKSKKRAADMLKQLQGAKREAVAESAASDE